MVSLLLMATLAMGAPNLSTRLETLIRDAGFAKDTLGIAVFDLSQTPALSTYSLSATLDMIPASVTKVATAVTALQRLGPSFKFQTTLWSPGAVKNGVLQGDLVLKGGGDAGFVSETMWLLVNDFLRTGIRRIEGSLIVDDSDFDTVRSDPSRDPERVDRAYDAPVGAMSFNWNSINIFVRPTTVGEAPAVYLDPIENGFTIENKAKTINKAGHQLDVSRKGNLITVRGSIGLGQSEVAIYKNIDDPAAWSGNALLSFLDQRGIKLSGKLKLGRKPDGAKLLARVESKALATQVADMMKYSNNYIAEMLTKNMAAQNGTTPATLDEGMKLIRSAVMSMGIAHERFTLVNPSGLSRRNRIKATDLAQILVQAHKNFPWFAEFLSSLPLAGLDGTLKRRMKDEPGWVRAKTGNLAGVAALAGYAGRKDGGLSAFAFIFNGKASQGDSARHLFDALASELVEL